MGKRIKWSTISDAELLDVRLCDLPIKLERSPAAPHLRQLYKELRSAGIAHIPQVWFSDEWFTPDGCPGFAVPFYLGHDRLIRLERRMMYYAEGAAPKECLQVLRHEAGHAISNAYQLHRRKSWREMFGPFSMPYPETYRPKPNSRNHVLHLDYWYAQVHPSEDFAETFAVWLAPGSRWKRRYAGWPALKKLEYVDRVIGDISGKPPKVSRRAAVARLSTLKTTLREYYRKKREIYLNEVPDFYDRDLRKIFTDQIPAKKALSAAAFLQKIRPEMRQAIAHWTGTYPYTLDRVLCDMIGRAKRLKLYLDGPESSAKEQVMVMLTVQTMNYIHSGHYRVAV